MLNVRYGSTVHTFKKKYGDISKWSNKREEIARVVNKTADWMETFIDWKTKKEAFHHLDQEDKMVILGLFVKNVPPNVIANMLNQNEKEIQAFINYKKKKKLEGHSRCIASPMPNTFKPPPKDKHLDLTEQFSEDGGCSVRRTLTRLEEGESSPPMFYVKSSSYNQYFKIEKYSEAEHSIDDYVPIEAPDGSWTLAKIEEVDEKNQVYHLNTGGTGKKTLSFENARLYPQIRNPYASTVATTFARHSMNQRMDKYVTFWNKDGKDVDVKLFPKMDDIDKKKESIPEDYQTATIPNGKSIKYKWKETKQYVFYICSSKIKIDITGANVYVYEKGGIKEVLDQASSLVIDGFRNQFLSPEEVEKKINKGTDLIRVVFEAKEKSTVKKIPDGERPFMKDEEVKIKLNSLNEFKTGDRRG